MRYGTTIAVLTLWAVCGRPVIAQPSRASASAARAEVLVLGVYHGEPRP